MILRNCAIACLVAACTPAVTPLADDRLRDWACPRPDTILEWQTNRGGHGTDHYHGADPGDPELCTFSNGDQTGRRWFLTRGISSHNINAGN